MTTRWTPPTLLCLPPSACAPTGPATAADAPPPGGRRLHAKVIVTQSNFNDVGESAPLFAWASWPCLRSEGCVLSCCAAQPPLVFTLHTLNTLKCTAFLRALTVSYIAPVADTTPVVVDVTSALSAPPKGDQSFGVDGKKVGTVATAEAVGIAPDGTNEVHVRARSDANAKYAPAKALATAYGENAGGGDVFVLAQARATGKPGLQYGALVAKTDATAVSGGATPAAAGNAVVLSTSRATGGQGQTVAGARASATSARAAWVGVDARANSAKWYMAPGNAVAGGEALGQGGHVQMKADVRGRADLGTSTTGVLAVGKSSGVQQGFWDMLPVEANIANGFKNTIYRCAQACGRAGCWGVLSHLPPTYMCSATVPMIWLAPPRQGCVALSVLNTLNPAPPPSVRPTT